MKTRKLIAAFSAIFAAGMSFGGTICTCTTPPVAVDTVGNPIVDSLQVSYDAAWIGGDSDATVVIADNGTEVRRTTGAGTFTHTLTGDGRHELTYTTYIGGVAQDEVYTATVFKNWTSNISDVTAKQRYPWNGKVDITYTLTGDVTAGLPSWNMPFLSVTASNRVDGTTYTAAASALSGDTGTAEGVHHVVWDMDVQGLKIKSDEVVFAITYVDTPKPYCVIDLSGGANASSYPVTYVASVPSGGWTDEYKTTKLVLRLVEPGTFMMGGSYQVTLTKPFYCGVFEVTQKQYELVTGSNPSSYKGDMRPVEQVSWNTIRGNSSTYNWPGSANVDSNSFVGRLQARTGLNFDLPTEAQWEYACRAGATSKYNNGGDTENDLKQLGRYDGNQSDGKGGYSSNHTRVGSYEPNAWGLYDMHGNVWEWCLDWYGNLASGVTEPEGSSSGSYRVVRGGSWYIDAGYCTSSSRDYGYPSNEGSDVGFRLVRTLSNTEGERSPEAAAGAERADVLCAAEAAPVAIDSRMGVEPALDSVAVAWNAAWIGGDANATVVIADNGTEVKRATGAGEFTLPGIGRHELTYTTYIDNVAQDEVYTATVYKDWKYEVVDGGAVITETTQTSGAVTIPSDINGYPVTGIASGVFKDCTGISSVSIPESVTRIEDGTFEGCTGIVTVNVPILSWKVVPGFYEALFEGLESFDTTLSIFDAPVSIKLSAEKLESSIAHQEMCCYGSYMYFCGGKTYYFSAVYDDHAAVKVDSSWVIEPQWTLHEKRTGSISFGESGWHWIEVIAYNINGPGGIEDDGFRWWTSDDSTKHQFVDRGDGMLFKTDMSVGTIARIFPDSYDSLRVAQIVGDVSAIANGFFEGCAGLTEIQIPSTVTNIGASAFAGCVGLTAVDIPSGVTSIGSEAFAGCSNLTEVVIPGSVWNIGEGAFANCTNLRRVEAAKGLKGTLEAQKVFEGCPADLEIVYVDTATISNVTAKQRYPWNGKVDITYTLTGDVTAGFSPEAEIVLSMTASNRVDGTTYAAAASALSGDTGTAEGAHHVIWDLNAQGIEFVSDDVLFTVAYVPIMRYCVIDLSGGANASSYPVTYVASVPSGGFNTYEYKTTKLVLRLIEPGTFMMGGSYQVTLTKPFYCGVFEVTQKQYELVTGSNPSYYQGDMRPVEQVSWNTIRGNSSTYNWPGSANVDSNSFVGRLQARTGLSFDLPTEAQWEYACRAGTTSTYNNGGDTENDLKQLGRYSGNRSDGKGRYSEHTNVGSYEPNAWGLYDMHGNVWEWCLDWYGSLSNGVADPVGSSSGSDRVLRGGSWNTIADYCTSSYRYRSNPSYVNGDIGFRLARTLSNTEGERSPEAAAGAERADALCAAEAAPVAIDSRMGVEPVLDSVAVAWNAAWIGGDANATVVIADNGAEVKRATGAGEFTLPGIGRHELTYTTYIDGVAQDEVYTATVYGKWKYEVVEGGAVITETTQTSGTVTIPAEIDGYHVRDIADGLFDGCTGVRNVTIPANLLVKDGAAAPANEWVLSPNGWKVLSEKDGEYQSATIGNNGSTSMSLELTGPYELSFDWKVSSEGNCDYLKWILDGTEKARISGTGGDWQTVAFSIPDGKHTVTWSYTKDGSVASGDDCGWVRVKNTQGGTSGVSYGSIYELFPDSYAAIQSVTLTGAATEIPTDAFAGCASLTDVTIPESVTRIGPGAFDGCTALTQLDLPAGLTDWGLASLPPAMREGHAYDANGLMIVDGWLLDCQDKTLSSLTVPEGVVGIGCYALADMYDMETVNLPQSLKYIADGAFYGDSYLDNLVLPDGVETIGPNAFADCSYLQNLAPIKSVRTVGPGAFAGCSQLSGVVFGEGLGEIGEAAFAGCWRMLSVVLPLSTTNVASSAFTGCTGLTGVTVPTHGGRMSEWFASVYQQITDVTVPEGETEVRADMFAGCSQLASVSLPEGVTNIAARAFKGCSRLSGATLPATCEALGEEAFANCSALAAMVLPESVARIGASVFSGCSSLATLTLSRSLTEIPERAFAGCSSLDSFVVPAAVTSLGARFVPSRTTAIYYLGNAPSCAADVYADSRSGLTSYVVQGTMGWDGRPTSRDIPQSWNGRNITTWTANRFDVTFDAAGGRFPHVDAATYACEQVTDTAYALPPFEPVRAGYTFGGYWTAETGGTRITASTRVTLTKAHTLYARWTADVPVTVRFNAVGGTVSPAQGEYAAGAPYGTLPVPTREHYGFAGWYTDASGGARATEATEVPGADHELFAHWTPCVYLIRYNACGGSGYMTDQSFTYGTTVTLRANAFSKANHSFAGWAIAEGGEAVYADGRTLTEVAALQNGVINLYAVWSLNRYAVRFDSNGGTGQMDNQTFTAGEAKALSACAYTRTGYAFAGWGMVPGGEAVYSDRQTVSNLTATANATVVLYAIWQQKTVAAPVVTPGDGATFTEDSCTVTITCATEGAAIYYSTDGSTPRPSNRYRYSGPFTIADTTEICAFAVAGDVSSDFTTVTITKTEPVVLTLAGVLDGAAQAVTTGGDADWTPVEDATAVGGSSARSGAIAPEESTWMEMTVSGAGTLSFSWKADCEKDPRNRYSYDFGAFAIDGNVSNRIDGTTAWQTVTVEIANGGTHVFRWTYSKDDYDEDDYAGEDCIWVDHVVWTPSGASGLTAWLAERNLTADARAANGRTAAECYALGLDPAEATNDFRIVSIEMVDGKPKVEWEPKVNRWTGAEILAVLKGAATLDGEWKAVEGATAAEKAAMRFFKVVVEVQ